MKDFWSVFRIALSVIALPLLATAAVSALNNNDGSSVATENVLALRSSSANMMNASFRNHSVSIDADGVVRGRIARIQKSGEIIGHDEMKVFFIQAGSVVSQVRTGADGSFEAIGLAAGNYSFVASGAKGYAAFGLQVTTEQNSFTNNLIEVDTVSPRYDRMLEIVTEHLPLKMVAGASVPGFVPAPGGNRVALVDGVLKGKLSSLAGTIRNGKVYLIQDQAIVATGTADENGNFELSDIESGVYEFVATAANGFAALCFEAGSVQNDIASNDAASPYRMVSTGSAASFGAYQDALDVSLVMPEDSTVAVQSIETTESVIMDDPSGIATNSYIGSDIGYGIAQGGNCGATGDWGNYSNSGCCGGGGGSGGFGGGGALASLGRAAILGWVLVELFDNIDFSDNSTPPPATPSS